MNTLLNFCDLMCKYVEIPKETAIDGSGFTRGIKGEDILFNARILAVAVAIEDLTSVIGPS